MKKTKEEKAITLIALVITIIVLLILAGVTISTLVGDDGIITKAQEAKATDETSKEKEAIGLAIVSAKVNNDAKIDTAKLKEELEGLIADGTIQAYDDPTVEGIDSITVTGATGTVYTISLAGGTITQTENTDDGDDDGTVVEKEDIEIGTVVSNYTAQDLEWKVFYVEEDESSDYYGDIYLITSDVVPVSKLGTYISSRMGRRHREL